MDNTKREQMIRRLEAIRDLPTLPVVVDRIKAAVKDPRSDGQRIAKIIHDDPAVMARILKVVNSAFYGGREPITSLQTAVSRLGMAALQNIALSTSVFSSFDKGGGQGFDRKEFWRHSICTGIAATVISEHTPPQIRLRHPGKDVVHLAGLLHDIGKIFYDQFFHDQFAEALRVSNIGKVPLFTVEKAVLGMDHAEAGMWLATKWKLSTDLMNVINYHHDPDHAEGKVKWFVELVHAANYICNIEKIGSGGDPAPVSVPDLWQRLGLTTGDTPNIVAQIRVESEKSESLLSLA